MFEIITANTEYPATYTHRIMMLCHEKSISYKVTEIDFNNRPEWLFELNPLGKIPVLRTSDMVLCDSRAIIEYIDTFSAPRLLPLQPMLLAQHHAWYAFADELANAIMDFIKYRNAQTIDLKRINMLFFALEKNIQGPYFFGTALSVVDMALISHLLLWGFIEEALLPCSVMKRYPFLLKWFQKMAQHPCVVNTSGTNHKAKFLHACKEKGLLSQYY